MRHQRPTILIGLDAMEISRVERLLNEGRLPHLRHLRESGCRGSIETRPAAFLSMVWPISLLIASSLLPITDTLIGSILVLVSIVISPLTAMIVLFQGDINGFSESGSG